MSAIDFFQEMILPFPKSVWLFFIGGVHAVWILYVVFVQKKIQKTIYKFYALYAFWILLWVWGNAYAESKLFVSFGGAGLKYTFFFVSVATTFAITTFYYISAFIKEPYGKTSNFAKGFALFMVFQNIFFHSVPNLAIERANVFEDGSIELVQGEYFFIFYIFSILTILLGWANIVGATRQARGARKPIQKNKLLYICAGISIMYSSSIFFHMLYPYLTSDYSFSFIPPTLSILDIAFVGYGILMQRFKDIKHASFSILKHSAAYFFSGSIGYLFYLYFEFHFKSIPAFALFISTVLLAFAIYFQFFRFFRSNLFYKIFQPTSLEHFKRTIEEFKKRDTTYDRLETLQCHIEHIFCEKLKIGSAGLVVAEASFEEKFPGLTEYFKSQKNTGILVAKEMEFLASHEKKEIPYLKELQELGEIGLPLYNSSGLFLGCLILGEKPNRAIYSQEEIELVESLQRNLNLELTGLLYQSQLQKTVEQKTAKIKAVMRQQTDFIANSAHELRTPTAGIVFGLEHISEEKGLPKGIREMVKAAYRSSQKLQKIVQTLFEAQSYDTDQIKLDIEKIKVHRLVAELAAEFRPLMEKKKIKFSTEIEAPRRAVLKADKLRLEQVLRNLLDNAAKFAPVAATVRLRVEREKGSFLFQVIDNGQGLPGDTKRHIFERFKTKDPYGSQGIGLGLYISREIVKLHQGKIWAENTVGGGATFLVELPARAA